MQELFERLGLDWDDGHQDLFTEAFTHRSAVHEGAPYTHHNERLEFLGDAVLELVVTEFLFDRFADKPEGELTALRAALVKGDHLAQVARKLDMGQYLILSSGERKSGGATKDYLLANVVEAFIGALHQSLGQKSAEKFIKAHVLSDLDEIIAEKRYIDAKSKFQEIAQQEHIGVTPVYKVLSESGKDHAKTFVVAAFINDKQVGQGTGSSKKEAQVDAARDALTHEKDWNK